MNKREAKKVAAKMVALMIENGLAAVRADNEETNLSSFSEADLDRIRDAIEEIQNEMLKRSGGPLDLTEFEADRG